MHRRVLALLAPFIAVSLCCYPQQAGTSAEVRFRADSKQVLVPVVVTDKKGHYVTGLKSADFQIFEDGVEQRITSFSSETVESPPGPGGVVSNPRGSEPAAKAAPGSAAPTSASGNSNSGAKRTYVIAFDTLHSSFANFGHVRDALEAFFKREKPNATAQFVLIGIGQQLRVIQPATSDPSVILARIRGTSFLDVLRGVDSQAMAIEVNGLRIRMEQYCRTCPCGPAAKSNQCYTERQGLRLEVNTLAERTSVMTRGFLQSLRALIAELGEVPTARSLILISDGFSLQPGAEFYGVAAAYLPNYADFRFSPPDQMEPFLIEILNGAVKKNISISAIDSRGVNSPSFAQGNSSDASNAGAGASASRNRGGSFLTALDSNQRSIAFQNGSGMSQLAAATGGVYFHESNDILKEFQTVIADGREYYLISYSPANPAQDGKFRRIAVELRDKNLSQRAKEGYWAN